MSDEMEPASTPRESTPPAAPWWRSVLGKLAPLIGLVFVWGLFALLVGENFIAWGNQRLMLMQTAVVGTAAVGATLIIISGGIDLSVGSMVALGTMVVALLLSKEQSAWVAAAGGVGVALAVGFAIGAMVIGHVGRVASLVAAGLVFYWMGAENLVTAGLAGGATLCIALAINELLIGRIPLSPFIVTLGMLAALRGVAEWVGDNQPIYPGDPGPLGEAMMLADEGLASVLAPGVWVMLGAAAAMAVVLRYTRFGRHVFAIGSNEETARLCGVRVERTKLLLYTLGVGCAGLAGVLQFSYLSMGDPTTAAGLELAVIAAVVIGGASLAGGEGSILGTLLGALIMTIVDNGCAMMGLENYVQRVVTGGIIVAAVALDRLRHRRAV